MLTTNSAPATGAVSRTYRVITDMLNREKCGINRTYCIKETCLRTVGDK
jgi:hypothetical protein